MLKQVFAHEGKCIIVYNEVEFPFWLNMRAARRIAEWNLQNPGSSMIDMYAAFLMAGIYGAKQEIDYPLAEEIFESLSPDDKKLIVAMGGECLNFSTELLNLTTQKETRQELISSLNGKKQTA